MKIYWHSNAPWASTGYGNQTRLFAPRLNKSEQHTVGLGAFFGLEGGLLGYEGMPVYPKGFSQYGVDVLGANATHFGADIAITLIDAWVIDPKQFPTVKWVPWFPVDMEPLPPPVFRMVNQAFDRIVFSRFGERMVNQAGLSCRYVPHGVDTKLFRPLDRAECNGRLKFPEDMFIVGMVAANKGSPSRKAFEPQFRAFAELKKKHDDALLYVHSNTAEAGQNAGVNLVELATYLGLRPQRDILFADQYTNLLGFPDSFMADLYNVLDAHMLVSMGEGFGIPIVEAQACGCPVITGDWTSMSELTFSGWKVPKSEADPFWTGLGSYQFQPRAGAILDQLEAAYQAKNAQPYRQRARDGALRYDVDKIVDKYWLPVLKEIEANL